MRPKRQFQGMLTQLTEAATRHGVQDRVVIDNRYNGSARTRKSAYWEMLLPRRMYHWTKNSYGYPTIQAGHSRRWTVTVSDAGGVLEFVTDGSNGLVVPPDPAMLGRAFDRLHGDRALARQMGHTASQRITDLGIDWDTVIANLLA